MAACALNRLWRLRHNTAYSIDLAILPLRIVVSFARDTSLVLMPACCSAQGNFDCGLARKKMDLTAAPPPRSLAAGVIQTLRDPLDPRCAASPSETATYLPCGVRQLPHGCALTFWWATAPSGARPG